MRKSILILLAAAALLCGCEGNTPDSSACLAKTADVAADKTETKAEAYLQGLGFTYDSGSACYVRETDHIYLAYTDGRNADYWEAYRDYDSYDEALDAFLEWEAVVMKGVRSDDFSADITLDDKTLSEFYGSTSEYLQAFLDAAANIPGGLPFMEVGKSAKGEWLDLRMSESANGYTVYYANMRRTVLID